MATQAPLEVGQGQTRHPFQHQPADAGVAQHQGEKEDQRAQQGRQYAEDDTA